MVHSLLVNRDFISHMCHILHHMWWRWISGSSQVPPAFCSNVLGQDTEPKGSLVSLVKHHGSKWVSKLFDYCTNVEKCRTFIKLAKCM